MCSPLFTICSFCPNFRRSRFGIRGRPSLARGPFVRETRIDMLSVRDVHRRYQCSNYRIFASDMMGYIHVVYRGKLGSRLGPTVTVLSSGKGTGRKGSVGLGGNRLGRVFHGGLTFKAFTVSGCDRPANRESHAHRYFPDESYPRNSASLTLTCATICHVCQSLHPSGRRIGESFPLSAAMTVFTLTGICVIA